MIFDEGWVKTERRILSSPLWNHEGPYCDRCAYIDLLLRANFKDGEVRAKNGREVITVHKGEIFVSIGNLAKHWKWSEGKVRRYLKMLENCKIAKIKRHTFGTLISFDFTGISDNERQTDGRGYRHADELAGGTSNRRTNSTQYKKDKKDKKDKNKRSAQAPGWNWEEFE